MNDETNQTNASETARFDGNELETSDHGRRDVQSPDIHEAQAHLDEAIDALESLLNERQAAAARADAEGQFTIPLLDEVVVPSPDGEAPASLMNTPEWEANAERIARFQPIFERLASEIEVIIQGSVDEALKSANQKILQRVRNHVAIVLPEILEELENEQAQERDQ